MKSNKFAVAVAKAGILQNLNRDLENMRDNKLSRYVQTGEKQSRSWNRETSEYEFDWEDAEHTIPKMEGVWENVLIPEDELDDEQKAYREAVDFIAIALEKLL